METIFSFLSSTPLCWLVLTVGVVFVRLQEAAHWIQSLSLSTGCNVLSALKLALKHRKDIDEITLILRGRSVCLSVRLSVCPSISA